MPKALALRAAAGAAALLLLCVAAAPALAQDACYSADQQVNVSACPPDQALASAEASGGAAAARRAWVDPFSVTLA